MKLNLNFTYYFSVLRDRNGLFWRAKGFLDTQHELRLTTRKRFKTKRRLLEDIDRFCKTENIDYKVSV